MGTFNKRILQTHTWQGEPVECPPEEMLSSKMLDAGRLILEAGISSAMLLQFATGLMDTLGHCPADVLTAKLVRLMEVAEGDIENKAYQKREAIRTKESTRIYREKKRKEKQRKRIEERLRLQREKHEQKLQAEQADSSG